MSHAEEQVERLRQVALGYPEAVESGSCTKAAFKVRKKGFLYVGVKGEQYTVLLKLDDSLDEAAALERGDPVAWRVGKGGWVNMCFGAGVEPPDGLLERWIHESYRRSAPKTLLKKLAAEA